jgi:ABC-type antimicrobial peptide transport system permease subunit
VRAREAATRAHLLVTSVRARRRDLAILKSIGFARRQVWATIGWQTAVLVGTALAVGIPLGVIGGRAAWRSFATHFGTTAATQVPALPFLAIAVGARVVTASVPAFPARAAARTRPGGGADGGMTPSVGGSA